MKISSRYCLNDLLLLLYCEKLLPKRNRWSNRVCLFWAPVSATRLIIPQIGRIIGMTIIVTQKDTAGDAT